MASKNISQDTESEDSAQALELIGISTGKVTSLCEKVKAELVTLGAEPEICTIFNYLCEAIRCINESQASLAEHQLKVKKQYSSFQPAPSKKAKPSSTVGNLAPIFVDISHSQPAAVELQEDAEHCKFKEVVKDAEKSMLLFNLTWEGSPL